jgi:uncharacterized protein (DUF1697 family)
MPERRQATCQLVKLADLIAAPPVEKRRAAVTSLRRAVVLVSMWAPNILPAMAPGPKPGIPYVAFLRGINVGGHKIIKMDALKRAFEKAGMKRVKTILASGNVLFESSENDADKLCRSIELGLEKSLGHPVGVVLRSMAQIEKIEKSDPFKKVTVTPATRLWVTLLKEKREGKTEVFTVFQVTTNLRAGMDAMDNLDKTYGKGITTRSWNTIGRILKAHRTS